VIRRGLCRALRLGLRGPLLRLGSRLDAGDGNLAPLGDIGLDVSRKLDVFCDGVLDFG
jgi:hypothetical protein